MCAWEQWRAQTISVCASTLPASFLFAALVGGVVVGERFHGVGGPHRVGEQFASHPRLRQANSELQIYGEKLPAGCRKEHHGAWDVRVGRGSPHGPSVYGLLLTLTFQPSLLFVHSRVVPDQSPRCYLEL